MGPTFLPSCALALASIPILNACQAVLPVDTRARLQSQDPVAVAWGLHDAAQQRFMAAVPDLHRILAARVDGGPPERRFLHLLAADALVQMGVTVSQGEAAALDQGLVLVPARDLMARTPERHLHALREIFDRTEAGIEGNAWRAAGNLLAQEQAPGFALRLLQDLRMKWTVQVVLPGQAPPNLAIGVGTGGAGGSFGEVAGISGFPPLPHYTLTRVPRAGDVVLTGGTQPLYYRREFSRPGQVLKRHVADTLRSDLTRLAWLATMAGSPAAARGVRLEARETIEFADAASYRARMASAHAVLASGFETLVQRLVAAGAMTGEEARSAQAPIQVRVYDERERRDGRLPAWRGPE